MNTNKRTNATTALVCMLLVIAVSFLLLYVFYVSFIDTFYVEPYTPWHSGAELITEELSNSKDLINEAAGYTTDFVVPIQQDIATEPTVQIYDIPLSEELQEYTYEMCSYYDIEDYYELVLAVMWKESEFTIDIISSSNDYGLMQINKCNHKYLQDELGIVDILDAKSNIKGGIYILSDLIHTYDTIDKALMAYNMGPSGAAKCWKKGTYASAYSRDVLSRAELIASNEYSEK